MSSTPRRIKLIIGSLTPGTPSTGDQVVGYKPGSGEVVRFTTDSFGAGEEMDTDALLARANHTGTQSADTITDGSTNKAFTAAEKTKLSGVASSSTANSSDATLLARANHTGSQAISTVTGLQAALDAKAASLGADDNYVTDAEKVKLGNLSGTNTGDQDLSTLAPKASPTFTGTVSGITKSMVGLGSVDNTSDAGKPVSTAQQTALDLKANLASPTFTGTVSGISKSMVGLGSVDNVADASKPVSTLQAAADATVLAAIPNSSYRTILDCSGSHIAARAAGTYWLGQGVPAGVTGTGTLYPPNLIYIDSADYPTFDGKAPKLRIRAQVYANDVAPFTGTFIFGLYPVTRPGTSGGAGLCIFTMGTVVSGSTVTLTNPAADSSNNLVTSDFALPANGHYVIGFITNQAMATSSHAHISAILQMRNA